MKYAFQRIREEVTNMLDCARLLTPAVCEGDAELVSEMQSLLRVGAQQLELRHKYLDLVPWSIVNADTPEGARAFLLGLDAKPASEHDELTRHLGEHLRGDLERQRDDDVCSPALAMAIQEYRWTPLDESAGEGYHRSTHHVLQRAPGSSDPYVKQATRVHASIKFLKPNDSTFF